MASLGHKESTKRNRKIVWPMRHLTLKYIETEFSQHCAWRWPGTLELQAINRCHADYKIRHVFFIVFSSVNNDFKFLAQHKTVVTPLHQQWSYHSLVLSHQNMLYIRRHHSKCPRRFPLIICFIVYCNTTFADPLKFFWSCFHLFWSAWP